MSIGVFLFTDIEGSTRLWSAFPVRMHDVLAQHDTILQDALEAAGGEVFKHTGDGMCAAYASARDAIIGAANAQRLLIAADWEEIGELRVRMAVHAGEAERRDGDWFGPALSRTARLMAVAHGGQLLVSAAAVDLAIDGFPRSLDLKDLGFHRLRDLAHPEHVWQVMGEGLPNDFPPLRSLDRFRGNLPTRLSSFLGREAELNELTTAAITHRLLTLVGPGGVGKTRLALQAAAGLVDKFADGTWFVELAPLTDGSALEHALAATLGLTPYGSASVRSLIFDALRDWRALVILDNCEHLVESAAVFAEQLLVAAPGVMVLATSREPLHVPGELVWPVPPLAIEAEAAQLFVDRAATVKRGFAPSDADEEAIATLCRRLDGMPLAIELAAARMRSMTTTEVLARLDRRFRLLGATGHRVVVGRHASLQGALDWSVDLLEPDERSLLIRLSVFAGTFSLEAAHAICSSRDDDDMVTLDLLDALVDKSLLMSGEHAGETRYWQLETMREYGKERMSSGDLQLLRLRHAEYFAEFAERSWHGMRGPDDARWLGAVEVDFDNIRAAFDYASSCQNVHLALRLVANLEPFNEARRNPEVWQWAETAIGLPDAADDPLVVTACQLLSFGGHARDNPPESERWAKKAAEFHQRLGLPADPRMGIMLCYGTAYQDRIDEATTWCREAIAVAERLGPAADLDRAQALYQLVFLTMRSGKPDVATGEEVVALARRLGNVYALVRASTALGLAIAPTDPVRARDLFDEALSLASLADPPFWTGSAAVCAAVACPNPRDALERLAASLEEYRATGTRQWIRRSLRDLLGPFGALGCHETVAFIDGSAAPFTTRPEAGQTAIAAAREHLGAARYDELKAEAAATSDADLAERIHEDIVRFLGRGC